MNWFDFEDEVNKARVNVDKANAVAEYLMQEYFGKRYENVSAEELKYGYETASMFSQILQDYTYSTLDTLENLLKKITQTAKNESPA